MPLLDPTIDLFEHSIKLMVRYWKLSVKRPKC